MAKIGMNDTVITSKEKNSAGPTSLDAVAIAFQRSSLLSSAFFFIDASAK